MDNSFFAKHPLNLLIPGIKSKLREYGCEGVWDGERLYASTESHKVEVDYKKICRYFKNKDYLGLNAYITTIAKK